MPAMVECAWARSTRQLGVVSLPCEEPLIVLDGILEQVLAQLAKLARVVLLQQRLIADSCEVILDGLLGIAEIRLGPSLRGQRQRLLVSKLRRRAVLRSCQGDRETGRQDQARRRHTDGRRQSWLPAAPPRQPRGGADRAREHGLALEESARERAGLTQEELSFRAGLSRPYVSQLERNLKSPTVATLFLICDALDVSAADVVGRVDAARKRKPGG